MADYPETEFLLRNPFTMMIVGPSKCGKTTLVNKLIKKSDWFYSKEPNAFFYFYNTSKPGIEHDSINNKVVEFYDSLPEHFLSWIEDKSIQYGPNITIIIDDHDLNLKADFPVLFNVGSHHLQANIIFISHNLFNRAKENVYRELSLNTDYFVLCKQVRDKTQIRNFFSQFQPNNSLAGLNAYQEATKNPYSYMLLDLHQETPDYMRMMGNIFWENNSPPDAYVI